MANHALFISWDCIVPGREAEAGELLNSALNYFATQAKEGVITSYEPGTLWPSGNATNGFILVRGDLDKLTTMRQKCDKFFKLGIEASTVLQGVSVNDAVVGGGCFDLRGSWADSASR